MIKKMPIAAPLFCAWTALLVVPTMGGQTAWGQGNKKEELPTYTVAETVVEESKLAIPTSSTTGAKISLPLRATAASVGVVSQALVESQAGTILGDALKNVSGVNVQTGFGIHDFFVIRGFDSLSSGLFVTGCAVDLPGEIEPAHGLGLETRLEIPRIEEVIFDRITRPGDLRVLETRD